MKKSSTELTVEHYLKVITKSKDKYNRRTTQAVEKVQTIISDFRLIAYNMRRTNVGKFAGKSADEWERQLKVALGI